MGFARRELLYLSALAAALPDMSRTVFAQVQSAAPKFSQILRQDLESQGQKVEETAWFGSCLGKCRMIDKGGLSKPSCVAPDASFPRMCFMLGPRGTDGNDSYVLGEINASSVFPIPDEAPAEIARRVADRLRSKL